MYEGLILDFRSRYFLAEHIFYCNIDGHFIVLNLKENEYILLGERERFVFQILFENKPLQTKNELQELEQTTIELLGQKILSNDTKNINKKTSLEVPPVSKDMNGYPFDGIPNIRTGHVFNCLKAFIYTKFVWWLNPMGGVIRNLKKRKKRLLNKKQPEVCFNQTRELVEIFRILRGLFYTVQDQCLFDSLVMINFLASYSIYPKLVFGVQMGPFGAHAWVQHDERIYNGHIFQAASFKPIMVV